MSGNEKDLRNAKTHSDPTLTFTMNELLNELSSEINDGYTTRQQGDVTVEEVMEKCHVANATASHKLNKLVTEGKLEKLWVRENGKRHLIYRKKA